MKQMKIFFKLLTHRFIICKDASLIDPEKKSWESSLRVAGYGELEE